MSRYWDFVAGSMEKGIARQQAAFDEVAPMAVGRPVDEVRVELQAALKRHKCTMGDKPATYYAEKLVRGEQIVVGKVVEQAEAGTAEAAVERS